MAHLAQLLSKPGGGTYLLAGDIGADEIERLARGNGLAFFRIDGTTATDKRALLRALAAALRFPATFGENWDALADCLGDLSWLDPGGLLLLWEDADILGRAASRDLATALQVLDEATAGWALEGRSVFVFVRGAGPLPAKLPRVTR